MYDALSTLLDWLIIFSHELMKRCALLIFLALPGAWEQVEGTLPPNLMGAASAVMCLWAVVCTAYTGHLAARVKPAGKIRRSASSVLRVLSWFKRSGG